MLISKISNSPNFRGKVLMDKAKVAYAINAADAKYHRELIENINMTKAAIESSTPKNAFYVLDVDYTGINRTDTEKRTKTIDQSLYMTLQNPENQAEKVSESIQLYGAKFEYDNRGNIIEQKTVSNDSETIKKTFLEFIDDFDETRGTSDKTMTAGTKQIFDKLA